MRMNALRYRLSLWFLQTGVRLVPDDWVRQKLMMSMGIAAGLIANAVERTEQKIRGKEADQ